MGTEAEAKSAESSAKKRQLRLRAMASAAFGVAVLIYLAETQEWPEYHPHFPNGAQPAQPGIRIPAAAGVDEEFEAGAATTFVADPLGHLQNCTIKFQPPSEKEEWSTKPLWFPSHPGTLGGAVTADGTSLSEDAFHKHLITSLTGLSSGGKSFYASSKSIKLKQCFGQTETATCSNIHPIVDMGSKHPETRSSKFHSQYIFGLRNPMLTLPAFYNGKQIKYHDLCQGCQVPEDEWRKHRDEWLDEMLKGWTNMIDTWKQMTKYKVGMYFVQEHLWDPTRGPILLQRLAKLLEEAGFATPDEADIPCLWLQTMGGPDQIRSHHDHPYEYKDYIPGYTVAQREIVFERLNDLAAKYVNDTELVTVLREYQQDIRTLARIDAVDELLLTNATTTTAVPTAKANSTDILLQGNSSERAVK